MDAELISRFALKGKLEHGASYWSFARSKETFDTVRLYSLVTRKIFY